MPQQLQELPGSLAFDAVGAENRGIHLSSLFEYRRITSGSEQSGAL
ncbi:hypothetical protein [Prosthecobacter sp.]